MSKQPKPARVKRTEAACHIDEHGTIDRGSDICKMLFVFDRCGLGEKVVILDAAEEKALRRRVRELERARFQFCPECDCFQCSLKRIHANAKPDKKGRRR